MTDFIQQNSDEGSSAASVRELAATARAGLANSERGVQGLAAITALAARAEREPLGVDVSDYSDEWVAGFLAGQENALELLLREAT